jgi:hypothetical protein
LVGRVYSPDEALKLFNSNFLIGKEASGSVGIFRIKPDGTLDFMPEQQFKLLTENLLVDDRLDPRYDGLVPGHIWWRGATGRHTRTLVFKPHGELEGDEWNIWAGFAIKPKKSRKLMQPLLRHIEQVICRGDPQKLEYLIRWLAFCVQHPDCPAETVIVLKSTRQGSGKSTLGEVLCAMFGRRHSAMVQDKTYLVGKFNDWLEGMSFVCAEEILWKNDYVTIDKLKGMVTGRTLQVERKYSAVRQVENHLHLMLTSNHELPVALGVGDRRYVIYDVSDEHANDRAWFGRIWCDLKAGGLAQFLDYLQTYPLGSWHPRELLKTAETVVAQHQSASAFIQWLQACIEADCIIGNGNNYPLGSFVESQYLREAYTKFCKEHGLHPDAPNIFGQHCLKFFEPHRPAHPMHEIVMAGGKTTRRPRGYNIPSGDALALKIEASL